MPGFSIWRVFQIFGIVSEWSTRALADGKITLLEAGELGIKLGALLGIPTDINVSPEAPTPPVDELPEGIQPGETSAETPPTHKPINQE